MSEDQKILLRNFISEHWAKWEQACEEVGEDPDDIYVNILEGELD